MEKEAGIERVEESYTDLKAPRRPRVVGNVKLIDGKEVVLVPTPSPDPKDPLNLPQWRKWIILIIVSMFGMSAVVLASGMGPIFQQVVRSYPGQEAKANDLQTYPTLFMGIGNLLAMPLALTIGRRPIFLLTCLVMVAGGIWCQVSKDLNSHIAGRAVMSLAAGQSEALAPLIIQEVYFLHERGRALSWFIFIENTIVAVMFIAETYLVSDLGWRWWYGVFTIFTAVLFVVSFVLLPETLYARPEDATTGVVELDLNDSGEVERGGSTHIAVRATTKHGIVLEPEKFGERTWRHEMRLWVANPDWKQLLQTYLQIAQGFCVPSIFWLFLMNGAWLGIYVFQASTFAAILIPPPWNFSFNALGPVQAGQIVGLFIFLPLLGYGSDWTIKFMSRRNGGIFKPEYRLIPLIIPAIVGVVTAIVYGEAAAHKAQWSVSAIIVGYNASFFAFLGANIVGITYAVESFPQRAASLLVVVCAGRGFISFGLSYATLPAVASIGYDGTMHVEAIVAGVLSLLAIPVYFFGPRIRAFGQRAFGMGAAKVLEEQ